MLLPESKAAHYIKDELSIQTADYDEVWEYLRKVKWTTDKTKKLICGEKISWAVVDAVGKDNAHILSLSPIALWKAVKNEVEIQGMRNAYLRDGVCWVKWAAWLDEAIRKEGKQIDEKQASDALIEERKKADKYAGMESYEAISASGEDAGEEVSPSRDGDHILLLPLIQLFHTSRRLQKVQGSLIAPRHISWMLAHSTTMAQSIPPVLFTLESRRQNKRELSLESCRVISLSKLASFLQARRDTLWMC